MQKKQQQQKTYYEVDNPEKKRLIGKKMQNTNNNQKHYEVDHLENEKCLFGKAGNRKSLRWLGAHSALKHHLLQICFCFKLI